MLVDDVVFADIVVKIVRQRLHMQFLAHQHVLPAFAVSEHIAPVDAVQGQGHLLHLAVRHRNEAQQLETHAKLPVVMLHQLEFPAHELGDEIAG